MNTVIRCIVLSKLSQLLKVVKGNEAAPFCGCMDEGLRTSCTCQYVTENNYGTLHWAAVF